MSNPAIFILPGLFNSGPQHWQSYWEQEHGFTRIDQKDWETPVCEHWINTIDAVVTQYPLDQVILVGHSLACCTVVHWANTFNRVIKGALLVAPSDVDAPNYPPGTSGFQPMPLNKLPFPSITITSSNDEYVSIERAQQFAAAWGSRLVNIGAYGHINSSSNLGSWPEGLALLKQLY
jgi:predicted alpha/beta hydrolase family esterase